MLGGFSSQDFSWDFLSCSNVAGKVQPEDFCLGSESQFWSAKKMCIKKGDIFSIMNEGSKFLFSLYFLFFKHFAGRPGWDSREKDPVEILLTWGLNSHLFLVLGDGHQPNSRGLIYPFAIQGGMTIPNMRSVSTLDPIRIGFFFFPGG